MFNVNEYYWVKYLNTGWLVFVASLISLLSVLLPVMNTGRSLLKRVTTKVIKLLSLFNNNYPILKTAIKLRYH